MSHQHTMEIRTVVDMLQRVPMPQRTAHRTIMLIKRLDAEIERLCKTLGVVQREQYTNGKIDGMKDFAAYLCDGRVSNDPVVIAVKCAVKEMTEEKK